MLLLEGILRVEIFVSSGCGSKGQSFGCGSGGSGGGSAPSIC